MVNSGREDEVLLSMCVFRSGICGCIARETRRWGYFTGGGGIWFIEACT